MNTFVECFGVPEPVCIAASDALADQFDIICLTITDALRDFAQFSRFILCDIGLEGFFEYIFLRDARAKIFDGGAVRFELKADFCREIVIGFFCIIVVCKARIVVDEFDEGSAIAIGQAHVV